MRRWSLIVVLIAALALGSSACGLKEADDAGDLSVGGDPTTEPEPGAAGPATGGDPSTDDTAPDDPFGDDPLGDEGSGDEGSGDEGSGDEGSGDEGSGGDDFCELSKESPDPTSIAAGDEFFERWRAAAPEELHDEIDVVTDWYEQSKSEGLGAEMPDDVLDALVAIGRYTVENCT
jgi:hypothetical protein